MRNILTLFVFMVSFAGTIVSVGAMIGATFNPASDAAHFAICAFSFILNAVFFWFIRDEVVY